MTVAFAGRDEKRLSTLFTRALRQRLRAILLEARYGGLQNLASFVSPFFILIVGAPFVLRGDMTIGSLLAFQQWTQLLYTHARSLYHTNQSVQQALGAAERVHQFFSEPVDSVRLLGSRRLERVEGALELQDVGFLMTVRCVLKDVNLAIEPACVALVGLSGAGKVRSALLLMRFSTPTAAGLRWTAWTCASSTSVGCVTRSGGFPGSVAVGGEPL